MPYPIFHILHSRICAILIEIIVDRNRLVAPLSTTVVNWRQCHLDVGGYMRSSRSVIKADGIIMSLNVLEIAYAFLALR